MPPKEAYPKWTGHAMLEVGETLNAPSMPGLSVPPNRLREWRLKRGFSQAELAGRARLSLGQIRKLEAGTRRLNQVTAARLAHVLACDSGDLFTALSTDFTTDSLQSRKILVDSSLPKLQNPPGENTPPKLDRHKEPILAEEKEEDSVMVRYATIIGNLLSQVAGLTTQVAALNTQLATLNERLTKFETDHLISVGPRSAGKMS